ncbi:bZIP transcription factor [Alteromonas gilva]|uniref:BZIP transcription factor n=1 Tax=Alteromonas gilva TaxID=2987522 RepID=A0ABT5L641_9ALTE|nr:bZIP transcription factor [Alteromonas gilva]MDC8832535.1 bZIP transcription factor [Alteromonas gilva]
MHLSEIPQRLGQTRTIVLLGASLLGMLVFGFILANVERQRLLDKTAHLSHSVANLRAENEQLQTESNQLKVKLELAQLRSEQLKQDVVRLQEDIFNLQTDKAFYQHVVAPETTQDGFFIDGLELFATATEGYYRITMVLLQQRSVSAVVKGELAISVTGNDNGQHKVLSSATDGILPEGDMAYAFKYFQPVTLYLQLPQGFSPQSITLSTSVFQYKRLRGEYERIYSWQDILVSSSSS